MNLNITSVLSEMIAKEPKVIKCSELLNFISLNIKSVSNFITSIQKYDLGKYLAIKLSSRKPSVKDVDIALYSFHHDDIVYFMERSPKPLRNLLKKYLNIYDVCNIVVKLKSLYGYCKAELLPIGNLQRLKLTDKLVNACNLDELIELTALAVGEEYANMLSELRRFEKIDIDMLSNVEGSLINTSLTNFFEEFRGKPTFNAINCLKMFNNLLKLVPMMRKYASYSELKVEGFSGFFERVSELGLGICWRETIEFSTQIKTLKKELIPLMLVVLINRCCLPNLLSDPESYDTVLKYLIKRLTELYLVRYIITSLISRVDFHEEIPRLKCYE